jgi:hypothetical protein
VDVPSFNFFMVVFIVDTESLKHGTSSIHVPIRTSTCTKIFILSLTVNDFHFPLLSTFHPFAVKFILMNNKCRSLYSKVIWALGNRRI